MQTATSHGESDPVLLLHPHTPALGLTVGLLSVGYIYIYTTGGQTPTIQPQEEGEEPQPSEPTLLI